MSNSRSSQKQNRELFQLDYVLPVGKGGQFEAGYRGSFTNQLSDVTVFNNGIINNDFTNKLESNTIFSYKVILFYFYLFYLLFYLINIYIGSWKY